MLELLYQATWRHSEYTFRDEFKIDTFLQNIENHVTDHRVSQPKIPVLQGSQSFMFSHMHECCVCVRQCVHVRVCVCVCVCVCVWRGGEGSISSLDISILVPYQKVFDAREALMPVMSINSFYSWLLWTETPSLPKGSGRRPSNSPGPHTRTLTSEEDSRSFLYLAMLLWKETNSQWYIKTHTYLRNLHNYNFIWSCML